MKVIFISKFNSYNKDISFYRPGTDGFFLFSIGQFIAREFVKRNFPIKFEIWRMDLRIKNIMEKEIDGIYCRIFPSKKISLFGKKYGEYSKSMAKAIKKTAKNPDIIYHFMPNHNMIFHWYARMMKSNTVVATHIGGSNPLWKFKNEKRYLSYFSYKLEKHFLLKNYSHTIAICKPEVEYFEKLKLPVTYMPIFGISREQIFTIKSRKECRKKLGLPLEKKILLQVGRAVKARGFDWIMDLIEHYQNKDDYFLVFAGIHEKDDFYDILKEKDVFITPPLLQTELPDYYNAADLLYYLPNGTMDLNFAGTSYVPLEALACGTSVVATTFHHFPGDEVKEVSRIPKRKEDVIPMIEDLLDAGVSREKCRDIVLKYFSWDDVIEKHKQIYRLK